MSRHHPVYASTGTAEPDAGAAARGALDGRVHADEPSQAVQAAGRPVARVDGGVRLDYAGDPPPGGALDLPAQGRDCHRW